MSKREVYKKIPALKFVVREFDHGTMGQFVWGPERRHIFEEFYDANELSSLELAERALNKIIKQDPQFIDAYNSLGWNEIASGNEEKAKQLFEKAVQIGNAAMPEKFSGRIDWGFIENRPFLRAMHGLGLCHLFAKDLEGALQIFIKMLAYNPNDNQGIRGLAIECNVALKRFDAVLEICDRYPDDILPETLYGRVLGYYELNKTSEAKAALKTAITSSPKVAEELLKEEHEEVESDLPGTVTVGGADEAYDYWERFGQYWARPGLLDFVRAGMKSKS